VTGLLASGSFSVSGAHGVILLIALILFAVAGIIAWVIAPRAVWATFVASGLFFLTLSMLWTG
jgi:hypothetical protein